MLQPLLTRLADDYHLVALDYPGLGHSDWSDPKQFAYTFDRIASFDPGEPERYRKDVPGVEVCVLDAGHFALDTEANDIAELVRQFMEVQG